MIRIDQFFAVFSQYFSQQQHLPPWEITKNLSNILLDKLQHLSNEYDISNNVAVHQSATIEHGVVLKGPAIIGKNNFIGAHAYLRGGVFLADSVCIGPACEVKSSIIGNNTTTAHFNFVGDSIIGSNVNLEAGAVIANHYNERTDKRIFITFGNHKIDTGSEKFGALVGDHTRIGANAVLSPGTILSPNTIVKRLELIA